MDEQEEFKDEDFQGTAAQFDVDYLERISTNGPEPSALTRQSLYVKFDPLVGKDSPNSSRPEPSTGADTIIDDIPAQSGQQYVPVAPLLDEIDADKLRIAAQKGELKYSEDEVAQMLEDVRKEVKGVEQSKYSEELAALQKELVEAEEVVARMSSGKGSGTLVQEIHKQDVALLGMEFESWRKLISEHERTETLIVNRHEEVKSKVRMIEDQCSAARSDFDSLENELDGLNQRYIKLRESALNLNTDQVSRKRHLAELEDSAVELSEQIKHLENEYLVKVDKANASYESVRKDLASKLAVERVTTKKLELQVVGLERELQQKEQEKQQLTQICDELLQELGDRH